MGKVVLIVSPTEPSSLRAIASQVSNLPERFGADVLFPSSSGLVGVQRKTVTDLVASLHDGRLYEDLVKLRQLPVRALVVEGTLRWAENGEMMLGRGKGLSLPSWWALMCSVQAEGVWVFYTRDLAETALVVQVLADWLAKPHHRTSSTRPSPYNPWGHVSSRDWALHLLQGFEGVGPEVATAIYEHFGGVPLAWTVSEKELRAVVGVGKGRARKLVEALAARRESKEGPGEGEVRAVAV